MADDTPRPRRSTATSAFGVSRREAHDASAFYARFATPEVSADDTVHPDKAFDRIVCGDARAMGALADASVALVVTSPPYFAGKEYEAALGEGHVPGSYLDYLTMLEDVFAECVRVLEPGGRIAVNVANLGRKPYRSLAADVTAILQDRLRLLLRGEVVWRKARGATGSCAWGSYRSPANPVLRDITERVVVAGKGRFDRALTPATRRARGLPWRATATKDEFLDATLDVWDIPAESATRVGHPAPFPPELPERFIHLYTYEGDLVLDPFMGSGSTAVAAVRTGRHFAGWDTDPAYVAAAEARVAQARAGAHASHRGVPDGPDTPGTPDTPASAVEATEQVLAAAGFTGAVRGPKLKPALDVALAAVDPHGRRWLVDVVEGLTVAPGGIGRSDALWAALGRAAVAATAGLGPFVVTVAAPVPASITAALRAVTGPGRPVAAIVDLSDPAGATARLRTLYASCPASPWASAR